MKKLLVFLLVLYAFNVNAQETSYDSEETHKIVRQRCHGIYKKLFFQLKRENMDEYKRMVNMETNSCECEVYAAYHVYGPGFMNDLLNKGYSYRKALERAELIALYKNRNVMFKYDELVSKCHK